jgi:immune inhibitor A
VCDNVWHLISDGVNQWVADQKAAGRTDSEIAEELATFDVYDRYDHDLDGDFNEPDGYIDHFQIVHSGGDQADGDPHQGEDAIWSHRWYTFVSDVGLTGPPQNPLGGSQIGDTGFWVGDYTIQPENGGLSVFAHEYGHDLGLPDLYDTSGGGDNSWEYWSLMAQSRLNGPGEPLGTRAGDLGAWAKLQLGWLDYEIVLAGERRLINQGPSEFNTRRAQATVVVLPEKTVTFDYGDPFAGERMWWSGSGDDLRNTMSTQVDATGYTALSLDLKARFEIEAGYDYLYVQTSTDGGATWQFRDGTVGGEPFVRDGSDNPAISGSSGSEWLDVNVPLDDVAGGVVNLRLLYATDGGVAPDGFFADEITVTSGATTLLASGAEDGDDAWALDGFVSTTGTETGDFPHYYIAATRSYIGHDKWLATGPYNFGWLDTRPDFVEHYRYQTGLLLSYWDTSQADNNTNEHPGEGLVLNIDSHPRPFARLDGELWRTRIQIYDAPFTWRKADSMTLHFNGEASYIRGQRGVPYFDDSKKYWYEENPNHGVKVPEYGVVIIVGRLRHDGGMLVWYGSKHRR